MADDFWLEKDRDWLLSVLPDATEAEQDFFVEKVENRWADMRLPDDVNRALTLGEVMAKRTETGELNEQKTRATA